MSYKIKEEKNIIKYYINHFNQFFGTYLMKSIYLKQKLGLNVKYDLELMEIWKSSTEWLILMQHMN